MKKSTPKRLRRKLVLRGEAIALLTLTQLDQVVGASFLFHCGQGSDQQVTCIDDQG
jgi:hypothetical protein